jgi:hypothetical protein
MPNDPIEPRKSSGLRMPGGSGLAAITLALAVVIGMQIGGVPWRFRKQLWQLQGAALGAVLGYVVGRMSGANANQD